MSARARRPRRRDAVMYRFIYSDPEDFLQRALFPEGLTGRQRRRLPVDLDGERLATRVGALRTWRALPPCEPSHHYVAPHIPRTPGSGRVRSATMPAPRAFRILPPPRLLR